MLLPVGMSLYRPVCGLWECWAVMYMGEAAYGPLAECVLCVYVPRCGE
jgi:hypothetical protein